LTRIHLIERRESSLGLLLAVCFLATQSFFCCSSTMSLPIEYPGTVSL